MMTSWNGNIFRVIGHLCGEFTGPRWIPRTKASDAELYFFDLRLNKRLSKQSWGWWFETLSRPLWRHRNVKPNIPEHCFEIGMAVPIIFFCSYVFFHCLSPHSGGQGLNKTPGVVKNNYWCFPYLSLRKKTVFNVIVRWNQNKHSESLVKITQH